MATYGIYFIELKNIVFFFSKFYSFIANFHWFGWLTELLIVFQEQPDTPTSDISVRFTKNIFISILCMNVQIF